MSMTGDAADDDGDDDPGTASNADLAEEDNDGLTSIPSVCHTIPPACFYLVAVARCDP